MNLCEYARSPIGPVALADLIAIMAALLAAGLHLLICFRWRSIALLPADLIFPQVLFASLALKSGGSTETFFLLYIFFLWPVMFVCYSSGALLLFLGWQNKGLAVRLMGGLFVVLVPFADLVMPGRKLMSRAIRTECSEPNALAVSDKIQSVWPTINVQNLHRMSIEDNKAEMTGKETICE